MEVGSWSALGAVGVAFLGNGITLRDGKSELRRPLETGVELDRRTDRLRFRFEGDQLVDSFEGVSGFE